MKFLKTIRFDASDDHVFERAAEPDEWAVSGAFAFADLSSEQIKGKVKQAFANGFLALETFGRSTFASVAECTEAEFKNIESSLATHFVEIYGAPDEAAALAAVHGETRFILDLCETPLINTIFTVRRTFDADEQIREEFRTIQAPGAKPLHTRIWNVVEENE